MKILYFNNGSGLGTAKSGGTTRHIETAKVLKKKSHSIFIVTTLGAYALYKSEKFSAKKFYIARAHLFSKKEIGNFDRAVAYLLSTIHSIFMVSKLPKVDIVYSISDYFCDVLPSIFYKINNPSSHLVIMIHHLCKSPFKRKGNFLLNAVSYIFQRLTYLLVSIFADSVLLYDTPEGRSIAHLLFKSTTSPKVHYVFNGIDVNEISAAPKLADTRYSACFAGGLRVTKGIYDLIPIWKDVVKSHPNSVLAIAGEGTDVVTSEFKNKIREASLEDNFLLLGALKSKKLYSLLKSSAVFVSSSHEEGWGIAVCEALAAGTPVVAFDLPAFSYLEDKIITVPMHDHKKFSNELIKLFDNPKLAKNMGKASATFIKKFDWQNIGEYEAKLLNSFITNENN